MNNKLLTIAISVDKETEKFCNNCNFLDEDFICCTLFEDSLEENDDQILRHQKCLDAF